MIFTEEGRYLYGVRDAHEDYEPPSEVGIYSVLRDVITVVVADSVTTPRRVYTATFSLRSTSDAVLPPSTTRPRAAPCPPGFPFPIRKDLEGIRHSLQAIGLSPQRGSYKECEAVLAMLDEPGPSVPICTPIPARSNCHWVGSDLGLMEFMRSFGDAVHQEQRWFM